MRRIQLPQFTRTSWLPTFLRRCINEFLTWFVGKVGAAKPFMPVVEEGLSYTDSHQIINLDIGMGANIETLKPYLSPQMNIVTHSLEDFEVKEKGLYTMINLFHSFSPAEGRSYLQKIAQKGHPIAVLEGNNNNWWQAVGMLIFVPLSVLLATPLVKPFRIERIIFTYLIPILPLIISIDGAIALFKLYGPKDLEELVSEMNIPNYQWKSGKRDNGRGGKIIYLLGYPSQ